MEAEEVKTGGRNVVELLERVFDVTLSKYPTLDKVYTTALELSLTPKDPLECAEQLNHLAYELLFEVSLLAMNTDPATGDSLSPSPIFGTPDTADSSEPFLLVPFGNPFATEIRSALGSGSKEWDFFKYILASFSRLRELIPAGEAAEIAKQLFTMASLLCRGYYSGEDGGSGCDCLILRAMVERMFPAGFLAGLMQGPDEELQELFEPVIKSIYRVATLTDITTERFRGPFDLLRVLVEIKVENRRPFCDMLTSLPLWHPAPLTDAQGREIAKLPLLSPLFNLSVFPEDNPKVAKHYFRDGGIPEESAKLQYGPIGHNLETVRDGLHKILHSLLANAGSRERTLDYLTDVVRLNRDRAKMRPRLSHVASNDFMTNFISVMYRLASKIPMDKVNPLYPFHEETRVDIAEESRFKMTLDEAKTFLETIDRKFERKFVTECLFLCLHAQHLSIAPLINRYNEIRREETRLRQLLQENEQAHEAAADSLPPFVRERNRINIERQKLFVRKLTLRQYCIEAILLREGFLLQSTTFCISAVTFLSRLASAQNNVFKAYPDFYLQDSLDVLAFVLQNAPQILNHTPVDFNDAFLHFLCDPTLFTSPYLAARLVEVMFLSCHPSASGLNRALLTGELAYSRMFTSLVQFYVDCEFMEEFQDKWNVRYHIQVIFKVLWSNATHRSIMIEQCRERGKSFVKFVNMLINDTTYLLDNAMDNLKSINEVQTLKESGEFMTLSRDDQQAKEELLSSAEGSARSHLQLSLKVLDLFDYMSQDVQEPFLSDELAPRLAAMLNYNLAKLCGDKMREIKVRNPEKYLFEPKKLLSLIISIYLNLGSEKMYESIAADERSYSPELFKSVIALLRKRNIVLNTQIELFERLAERTAEMSAQNQQLDEDLGDIPDEFSDPILGTLMKHPVQLPSGHVVDREVIQRHLLSDPNNPFNRQPLTEEELVDCPELLQRIKEWVKSKRRGQA